MSTRSRLLLRIGVSLGVLFLVFRAVPLAEIFASLRGLHPWLAAGGFALALCMVYLAAIQTRILARNQGLTLSVGQIFRISFITNFYGLFLPGTLAGGAIRWYKFTREEKKPAAALTTVVSARLLNTTIAVFVGIACWSLDESARNNPALGAGLVVVLATLALVCWLLFHGAGARAIAAYRGTRSHLPRTVRGAILRVLRSATKFRRLSASHVSAIVGLLLLYHLLGIVSLLLYARALDIELGVVSLGWVRTYVILITLVPVSISGLGVREGGLIYMLHAYGVSPALAVALSFVLFLMRLAVGAVGGILEVWDLLSPRKAFVARRASQEFDSIDDVRPSAKGTSLR